MRAGQKTLVARNAGCVKSMNKLTPQFARLTFLVIAVFMCATANSAVHSNETITQTDTSDNQEHHLLDHCIGGTAHELVAQANIVTAKKYPEYGLSENLAVSCPRFVWVVLQAESLSTSDKKRAFAGVMNWSRDERMRFFLPLRQEVDGAAAGYWKDGAKPD